MRFSDYNREKGKERMTGFTHSEQMANKALTSQTSVGKGNLPWNDRSCHNRSTS